MAPTLAMTLLVRDEADVLDTVLRYHLDQGVDVVVAMDNGSGDATPEILRAFEAQGAVRIVPCPAPDEYRQAEWVTLMARLAATEHGADWVINADADEFWWPIAGSLRDVLEAVPDDWDVLEVPRTDFIPAPDDDRPFHQRVVIRETLTISPTGWPLLPKIAHRADPDVEVAQGNHAVVGAANVVAAHGLVEVLHFPMRDFPQFERKVVKTGEAFGRTPAVAADSSLDQRSLYELHTQGRLREYYESRLLDDDAVRAGLADGTLVRDDRLARFLAAQGAEDSRAGPRPEAAAVKTLGDAALRLPVALRDAEAAERRRADAEAELADARLEIAALETSLQAMRDDLVRESEALAAIRASRLMRSTRAARRAYYGVRDRVRRVSAARRAP